ncbi:MAG: hypothetical protein KGL54_10670 [Sphingomonadales bacterium]|nr:hypothetical protein [Sphingomonadales bacterium]
MVDQLIAPNGAEAEPVAPQQTRRVVALPLPAPYDMYTVQAWINYPRKLAKELGSGDAERIQAALQRIIVGHDLTDFDGRPLPPVEDAAFFDEISDELLVLILRAVQENMGKLAPTSGTR